MKCTLVYIITNQIKNDQITFNKCHHAILIGNDILDGLKNYISNREYNKNITPIHEFANQYNHLMNWNDLTNLIYYNLFYNPRSQIKALTIMGIAHEYCIPINGKTLLKLMPKNTWNDYVDYNTNK